MIEIYIQKRDENGVLVKEYSALVYRDTIEDNPDIAIKAATNYVERMMRKLVE